MQRGLTLIEVMITLAIIGILATIAIPNLIVYREKKLKETPAEEPKAEAEKVKDSIEPQSEVKKLFEVDGCSVYEWKPGWGISLRYFISCPGGRSVAKL